MTDRRPALQAVLESLAGDGWSVYFQPPSNVVMQYPCITYQRYDGVSFYADNATYAMFKSYQVTVIDANPDSLIPDKVEKLPLCSHNRFYIVNNLNHNVYNLYF